MAGGLAAGIVGLPNVGKVRFALGVCVAQLACGIGKQRCMHVFAKAIKLSCPHNWANMIDLPASCVNVLRSKPAHCAAACCMQQVQPGACLLPACLPICLCVCMLICWQNGNNTCVQLSNNIASGQG